VPAATASEVVYLGQSALPALARKRTRAHPISWGGQNLGNLSVEGVYLYPLPVKTGN
jgi:hypothetical protein